MNGLREEMKVVPLLPGGAKKVYRVCLSGEQQDLAIWPELLDPYGQLDPGELGHHHIADYQVRSFQLRG